MNIKEMLKGLLVNIVESKNTDIADPIDYKSYLEDVNWTSLMSEVRDTIRPNHLDKPGVYVIMGFLGDKALEELNDTNKLQNRALENKICLYIGKSSNVGQRLYDHFYNPDKSQIIPNARNEGYEVANENHRRLEGLHNEEYDPEGNFEIDKIYVSDIHIFTFSKDDKGLAGRDICEILLIQRPNQYPFLNKQFVYRETGLE